MDSDISANLSSILGVYSRPMSEFDGIRPYHDYEVPEVVARIVEHPELSPAAARLIMPRRLQESVLGKWLAGMLLRSRARGLRTVEDCQQVIANYFEKLIEQTTLGVSVTGIENLSADGSYLFVSNHRDIVLDSSLLNYKIHQAGLRTSRMAVGDNLLTHELAADLMKLNKSFVVERGARGTREGYRILTRTSRYIRHSLLEGESVWIAQREGRAKDGWDRTDPALLKMLSLAYRDEDDSLNAMVAHNRIVPVAITYELDPCAMAKAHELYVTETEGHYAKSAQEDVQSIITGLVGPKGRIHLHIGTPIEGEFAKPGELAGQIDKQIVGGLRVFPTHVRAAQLVGDIGVESAQVDSSEKAMALFNKQRRRCPEHARGYWLLQYANLVRNRRDLGVRGKRYS